MELRKPPAMTWRAFLIGLVAPHSVVRMREESLQRRMIGLMRGVQQEHAAVATAATGDAYSYEAGIAHLVGRGLPEDQVREGSMPEAALDACGALIAERLDATRPITVLHVGNFVGVSLAWFTDLMRRRDGQSLVIGLDPNVVHRGIEHPQEHVVSLLNRFQLQRQVLLITGYTMEKNLGDFDPAAMQAAIERDQSCENALSHLARIASGRIDVAVMDGFHESEYLRRELQFVRTLLAPGGLLVLDDVFDWSALDEIARELAGSSELRLLTRDDRFGAWEVR